MRRICRVMACAALAVVVFGCQPAFKYHSASERKWGSPSQRWEGCCQPQAEPVAAPPSAVATAQLPANSEAAQAERDRLREEAVERRLQAFRDAMAEAETERKAKETAEAEAWEVTRAEVMALDLEARKERLEQLLDDTLGDSAKRQRVMQLVEEHNREVEREVAKGMRNLEAYRQKILEMGKELLEGEWSEENLLRDMLREQLSPRLTSPQGTY